LDDESCNEVTAPFSLEGRYTAPECFKPAPTLKSDIFSLGLILCVLLSGKPRFSHDLTQLQIMHKVVIKKDRPDIPEFILPAVRDLISKC
jgi:serine/threonine protein kinase